MTAWRRDALSEGFSEVAKALSSGRRAETVDVLTRSLRMLDPEGNELCVCDGGQGQG